MSGVILVTGAAGFVGSHLIQLLSTALPSARIVAWRRPAGPSLPRQARLPRSFGDETKIQWMDVDLLDPGRVATALKATRPSAIYHCAGAAAVHTSWDEAVSTLELNVRGTDSLLSAASATGIRSKTLIPGSALIYKPTNAPIREADPIGPVSPYGLSKLAQEMLAQQFATAGLDIVLTRSFTHLGPGQDPAYAAASFARQIARIEAGLNEPVLKVGSLEARRDLTDVRDTVRAYRALMERGTTGRLYNVCSGKAHRIGDLLQYLVDQAKVAIAIEIDPSRLRPSDNLLLVGDPTRITTEIGWTPTIPLEHSLRDLLEYSRHIVAEETGTSFALLPPNKFGSCGK